MACSFGNDGRSAGFRSTPHPGMASRSSSLVGAVCGFSRVYATVLLLVRRYDEWLDAPIEFVGHQVVAFRNLVERDAVRHDLPRFQNAVSDVLEEPGPLSLHRALVGADREAFV